MLRIIGVIFGVFALSGIIAMSSRQVPVDVVSVALVAVCLAIAVLCFRRRRKKKAQPEAAQAYSYVSFKVAGTSFETDGVSRQAELRKIKDGKPPYGEDGDVALKVYTYEGEPAVGCYVNDFQIGNVPKDMVPQVREALKKPGAAVSFFEVTGGGVRNGEKLHYGARMTIRYENKK